MTTMTITEARDRLDELLAKAARGEDVVIVRDDGSAFAVVPTQPPPRKKRGLVGSARGKIWMADDFDEIPEGFDSGALS
jgi:antitoxin (DNA-binding transcriptional repressor) of toxin-antitoxin stability system